MDLALFDFDGTITDRETMPDFMVAAVRPMRLVAGKVLLLPLIVGYKLRIAPGTMIRAAICWFGFKGVPVAYTDDIDQWCRWYLPAVPVMIKSRS